MTDKPYINSDAQTCSASWYCTDAVMASSSLSILSLHVRFRPSQAPFIWKKKKKRIMLALPNLLSFSTMSQENINVDLMWSSNKI